MKSRNAISFDAKTTEEEIADFVDHAGLLKNTQVLLGPLLIESHPMYHGRGSNEVIRIQGYILASFEKYGLTLKTLPIALEALESGMSAYLVAAAAKALRGLERKNPKLADYLLAAIKNVYYRDDTITFSHYKPKWPLDRPTTAMREILLTFQWLGKNAHGSIRKLERWSKTPELNAVNRQLLKETIHHIRNDHSTLESCCDLLPETLIKKGMCDYKNIGNIILEDHDGRQLAFGEFFRGKPTVLVFFYTRCENHNKCSLTINKLGKLQKLIQKEGIQEQVKTAAISYDASFDTPERLRTYAIKRHVYLNDMNRIFRVVEKNHMAQILKYVGSAVNYSGSLINKHQIELYILNTNGKLIKSHLRLQWDPQVVVNILLKNLYKKQHTPGWTLFFHKIWTMLQSSIIPLLIIFFPKCPLCWAAYMSMFGIAGISSLTYSPWLLPLLCVFLFFNLWFVWRRAEQRKNWTAFGFALIGSVVLVLFGSIIIHGALAFTGLVLVIISSFLNSLSPSYLKHFKRKTRVEFIKN